MRRGPRDSCQSDSPSPVPVWLPGPSGHRACRTHTVQADVSLLEAWVSLLFDRSAFGSSPWEICGSTQRQPAPWKHRTWGSVGLPCPHTGPGLSICRMGGQPSCLPLGESQPFRRQSAPLPGHEPHPVLTWTLRTCSDWGLVPALLCDPSSCLNLATLQQLNAQNTA